MNRARGRLIWEPELQLCRETIIESKVGGRLSGIELGRHNQVSRPSSGAPGCVGPRFEGIRRALFPWADQITSRVPLEETSEGAVTIHTR